MSDITIGSGIAPPPAGQLTRLEVLQNGKPVRVLDGWKNITFIVDWELNPVAYALAAATGRPWEIQLHADSIGAGYEGPLHTGSRLNSAGRFDSGSGLFKFNYEGAVTAPVPEEHGPGDVPGPASGVYRLAGTLFLNGTTPYFDMVAFDDIRLVMHEPLQ